VAALLLFMRRGLRRALWCTLLGVGATVVYIVPFSLHDGRAMVNQVVRFPLGLARVATPAANPLPGHALADLAPAGRVADLGLIVVCCAAVAVWTPRRPPRTAVEAVNRLAAGLTVGVPVRPSSRFGYFAPPLILWLLPHLASGSVQLRIPWKRDLWSLRIVLMTTPPAAKKVC
jgi:hypothetical protein